MPTHRTCRGQHPEGSEARNPPESLKRRRKDKNEQILCKELWHSFQYNDIIKGNKAAAPRLQTVEKVGRRVLFNCPESGTEAFWGPWPAGKGSPGLEDKEEAARRSVRKGVGAWKN